jgi:hypothetical protein
VCCEQLVCAQCAGRVADARCSSCRAARDALHHRNGGWSAYAVPLVVALALLLYVVLLVRLHTP